MENTRGKGQRGKGGGRHQQDRGRGEGSGQLAARGQQPEPPPSQQRPAPQQAPTITSQRFEGTIGVAPVGAPRGSAPFSGPRGAPAPFSTQPSGPPSHTPEPAVAQQVPASAWGPKSAPPAPQKQTQDTPATDPALPQPAQQSKSAKKKKGKQGAGKQAELAQPVAAVPEVAVEQPSQQAKPTGKGKRKGKDKQGGGDVDSKSSAAPVPSKATPPVEEVTKQMAATTLAYAGEQQLMIPRRPYGQAIKRTPSIFSKKFVVEVNYLPINFKDIKLKIFHYDVEFKPDRPKSLYRVALKRLLDKYVSGRHPAFDGKKNMYVAGTKLAFPKGDSVLRDTIKVFDQERGKDAEFDITVKLVDQDLNLSKLMDYMKSGTSLNIPQDVIQGVDIALRNAPITNHNFVPVGRSFFAIPTPNEEITNLGGGFELWHGHYQSAIMAWKPYLNVDVANKAFPIAQSVLDFIYNELQEDPRNPLPPPKRNQLLRFLKGLKIDYNPSNDRTGLTKRTYKVHDLGDPPNRHRFKPDKEGSREITVEQYFKDVKKIPLRYPHLPSVVTSNKNYLPIEFCAVTPNQAVMRKLNERQTSQMVRNAAKPTDIRKARIMRTIEQSGFNNDPCAREFGITVNTNFERVDAMVLQAPRISYANAEVDVRNGVWQTRTERFIQSPGLQKWAILNTDRKTGAPQIQNLVKNFKQVGQNIGIPVQDPIIANNDRLRTEFDFESEFRKYKNEYQIVVVIMNPFIEDVYSKIKRAAELKVGVLTQCLKANTCDFRKMNAMTAGNILLKINSKISGVNHSLAQSTKPEILRRPVMIVGADVTHPAPGSEGLSIAAVAASHDKYAFQYNMLYRLQPGRKEMIVRLEEMIQQQLKFFYGRTGVKPERILYYRDGVSEGQFLQVLNIELRAIRAACKKLENGYEPAITFLVVQKRHHTRFFPSPKDYDPRDRNKNVAAGTLVDTGITHPTEIDFYLVSHQSIQGTARPTKYHLLWDDSNIPQDELEQLTYYLCHMFSRCNRSVSYPAPTYYAHLAAFRARAWWDGQRYDAINLAGEQERNGRIQDHIVQNAPMFFV